MKVIEAPAIRKVEVSHLVLDLNGREIGRVRDGVAYQGTSNVELGIIRGKEVYEPAYNKERGRLIGFLREIDSSV